MLTACAAFRADYCAHLCRRAGLFASLLPTFSWCLFCSLSNPLFLRFFGVPFTQRWGYAAVIEFSERTITRKHLHTYTPTHTHIYCSSREANQGFPLCRSTHHARLLLASSFVPMNPDDVSEGGSIAEPLPQDQITMLLNLQDFQEKVTEDQANLCCVIVTSTLCRHCGIRRIPYPKVARPNGNTRDNEDGESEDEDADVDGDEGYGDEEDSQEDSGAAQSTRAGHFYRDFENYLVRNPDTAVQRRHTRFFHVCACMEEETCVDFLIAADPAYSLLNKQPSAHEIVLLHKKAHHQLKELLNFLEVRSTPSMRFYLAGKPLRYSAMPSGCSDAVAPKDVTAETDVLQVSGANWIKWSQVLQNAVVVRNEVMRSYDTEVREKARAARAEARRQARRQRRMQEAEEEGEEDEEAEEDG
ncbi:hypothetical protein, conserved [Leishmania tarentolae]|uniref:Uncharacterized protein n=1 Tax=Leishmania tarentolae TaxID=5689 RepID=A0A640KSU6_LEITA|nr:hypothetical protein, conserved [Leishmania tarentolae]